MDALLAETPDAATARPRVLVLSGPAAPYDGLPVDLAEHGFDAYHEARIGDAVRKLAAIDPCVLVLVPATPGEAEEALRTVRAAPRGARLPVLVCATERSDELLAAARREHVGILVVGAPEVLRRDVIEVVRDLAARPVHDARRPQLLVMDDNVAVQALTRNVFHRAGFDVRVVERVGDALELVRSGATFDAALLDLNLPDGSGFDVLRAIRERGATPVLIFSAMGQATLVARAFDLGATDYIEKPFDPRELRARVARHL